MEKIKTINLQPVNYENLEQRKADKAFYNSTAWKQARQRHLKLNPLCVDCKKRGFVVAGTEVHHITDRKINPSLALDPANLETCCKSCHNRKRGKSNG